MPARLVRSFGRRRSRRLRPNRQALLTELLPALAVPEGPAGSPLDPAALFDPPVEEVWLEVGFGAGEHLFGQARARPAVGLIGCEPFVNGVTQLLAKLAATPCRNVRIFADDVRLLLPRLRPASLSRVVVLFPDPWPKRRHHRRRLVSEASLVDFARVLKDGGELRIASDHGGYVAWVLWHALRSPDFEWLAREPGDWRHRFEDAPESRYEAKARQAGRRPVYLRFGRRHRPQSACPEARTDG